MIYLTGSQNVVWGQSSWDHFWRSLRSNSFIITLRIYLPFSTLTFSQVYSGVFKKLYYIWKCNSLNAEAGIRIQLSSSKPEFEEIWGKKCNIKQYHSSHYIFFCFGKYIHFSFKCCLYYYKYYINIKWAYFYQLISILKLSQPYHFQCCKY